jgi:hypothetical protein
MALMYETKNCHLTFLEYTYFHVSFPLVNNHISEECSKDMKELSRQKLQMNDSFTDIHNTFSDLIIKYTHNNNNSNNSVQFRPITDTAQCRYT